MLPPKSGQQGSGVGPDSYDGWERRGRPGRGRKEVGAAESELGLIDILISNAGIALQQDLEDIGVED